MIKEIHLKKFKRFETEKFKLNEKGLVVCAGPNSSGKSTLLHALAVWSFGLSVVRQFKGDSAIRKGYKGQGAGISDDDFTPINIPDLKHLWHNLKYGGQAASYSMSITAIWDETSAVLDQLIERQLTMAFSLVQDRLYIKAEQSNLDPDTVIPSVVYVPPVAGLDAREEFATVPKRRAMLGRGLAGAVLRNHLYDLEADSKREKERLRYAKGGKKLNGRETENFRKSDPWERLNAFARDTFGFELNIVPFDASFHSILRVNIQPKRREGNSWRNSGVARDLMVEGSGAQQWLTVLTFALSPDTNVLLLDEPDAHLFTGLKIELVDILKNISTSDGGPQILMATHSTEILKRHALDGILNFGDKHPKFLSNDTQRAKLISGLGDDYSDLIEKARASRALLFVESDSDRLILEELSKNCGTKWPENIAIYVTTDKHSDRFRLYKSLLGAIDGLKSVSVRDRDDANIKTVDFISLRDRGVECSEYAGFFPLTWRRREIENYALNFDALLKDVPLQKLQSWWSDRGWALPSIGESEEIFNNCDIKIDLEKLLGKNQVKIFLKKLKEEHVHRDIRVALDHIAAMS
jgi:predicted ATPase